MRSLSVKMAKLTHYAKRYSVAFDKFVNAPHMFKRLWEVNSNIKPLQKRQRVTLVRVIRVMLAAMDAENNQVGICNTDAMHGITHVNLMKRYKVMFGESITKGRWYRAIKQLVNAGYLISKSALTINGTDESPLIRSIASLKEFTKLFFSDLNLEHKKDIRESRAKCVASRISQSRSSIWYGYKIFNKIRKHTKQGHGEPVTYDEVPSQYQAGIFSSA